MKPHTRYLAGEKIMYFSMIYFAVVLPFQFRILSPTIGIIGILLGWLISFRPKLAIRSFTSNLPLLFVFALFILGMLSYFYTENTKEWGLLTVLKLPTFLLPLALGTSAHFTSKHRRHWLLTFAFSTAFSCLILFGSGLYRYIQDPSQDYFYHQAFVVYNLISVHYFSMYCIFAFVILLYFYLKQPPQKGGLKPLYWLSFLLLIAALYSGAARMQIATFVIAILAFITWYFSGKLKFGKLLLYQLTAVAGVILLVMAIPSSRKRVIETYREWMVLEGMTNQYQTNHRVFIWRDGLKVIKNHTWLGTGMGSADDELYEYLKLETAEFWRGNTPYTLADSKYNFHNSYLQHWAALGILGLLLLLLALFWPFIKWGSYPFLTYIFLLILSISLITESMLERQAGTLFFAFFYAIMVSNLSGKVRPSALAHHKKPAHIA